MIDEFWDKGKVTANIMWAVVLGFMTAGWGVILLMPSHWQIGGMFAATACAASAFAAVLHIRCYMVRLAGLVRASSSVRPEEGPSPLRRF